MPKNIAGVYNIFVGDNNTKYTFGYKMSLRFLYCLTSIGCW